MLRIVRPDDDGPGPFAMSVDDKKVGTLNSGDQIVVYVPAGSHVVRAKFAWIASGPISVDVAAGTELQLTAKRRFGFGPFDVRYFTQRKTAIEVTVS